jgi:hypothetical protein
MKSIRLRLSLFFVIAAAATFFLNGAAAKNDLAKARFISHIDGPRPVVYDPFEHFKDGFAVSEKFTSHLPLVVIDTNDVLIPINHTWDTEKGYAVPIEGVEAYVSAKISVYENAAGMNGLLDIPAHQSMIEIKRRGNSSMSYEKAQWRIKLVTDSGEKNKLPLLGMETDEDWILNGSMIDKSLMRNYLAFTLAAEFMPYVPDARYCEVFIKEKGDYVYQGVYLLMESIKQGGGRVEISDLKTNGSAMSYIVRRDRYSPYEMMLDTYATRQGLTEGHYGLIYPKNDNVTPELVSYVENDLSAVERVLYSDDPNIFLTYPDYIDVDSFVNYFLINEFLTNYDVNSTYLYKDFGGKLNIGPVWDFDGTIDNYRDEALDTEFIVVHMMPWYERLIMHDDFINKLVARYSELRRSTLNNEYVEDMITDIARYLDAAEKRDWMRWEHIYTGENNHTLLQIDPRAVKGDEETLFDDIESLAREDIGEEDENPIEFLTIRQTEKYEHEIIKIKYLLRKHGGIIHKALLELHLNANVVKSSAATRVVSLTAFLFVIVFFSSVYIIRKRL